MNSYEQMKTLLENMGAEVTVIENSTFKRIDVVDSGGSDAIFFFDSNGGFVSEVPMAWIRKGNWD